MTGTGDSANAGPPPPAVDAVHQATLALLASLPERPERLRVRVADALVDLDWRPPVAPVAPAPAGPAGPTWSAPPVAGQPDRPATPPTQGEQAGAAQPADTEAASHHIHAPTVGVFYHAPEPGATPFVSEGAAVTAGQQVGIVEAMKLMLPVEADRAGRVLAVLVPDGQPVEYGQPLIALGPPDGA